MDEAWARLLFAQGGVATHQQLRAHLTRRGLEQRRDRGDVERIWPGVYSLPEPDLFTRLRGIDLSAGVTVPACLGTAAALHGFDTEDVVEIHVLNPHGHQLRPAEGLVIHRRNGAPLCLVDGRPVTTPPWTCVEVARALRRPRALATLDAALSRGVCTREELWRAARRQSGRRGIVAVRELIPLADGLAESPMESEARLAMLDGGLPAPVLQYEIVDANYRRWRVDFAWPDLRVAAEYEGVDWHSSLAAWRRDRERYAALQQVGWNVVPILADDVRRRPGDMVRRINAQLERAGAA